MSVILRPDFPSPLSAGNATPADAPAPPSPAGVAVSDPHLFIDLVLSRIEAAMGRTCDQAVRALEAKDFPLGDRKVLHYQECVREIYLEVLSRLRMIQDDIHDDMRKYEGPNEISDR